MILFASLYHKNNIFHGDIKPSNIFYLYIDRIVLYFSMDNGSILYLGNPNTDEIEEA